MKGKPNGVLDTDVTILMVENLKNATTEHSLLVLKRYKGLPAKAVLARQVGNPKSCRRRNLVNRGRRVN